MALRIEKGGWLVIGLIGVGLVGYSLKKYGILDKIAGGQLPACKIILHDRVRLFTLDASLSMPVNQFLAVPVHVRYHTK